MRDSYQYAEGVNLTRVEISGWQAWMLVDAAPNGNQRPIALLDEEALQRITEQGSKALAEIRQERGEVDR